MKIRRCLFVLLGAMFLTSCVSTKLTIKNIDDKAKAPELLNNTTYKLTRVAPDKNYGYDQDYPVNIGFGNLKQRESNPEKFLKALLGPNGEEISYIHEGNCCPFPTGKSELGSGMLEVYTITWEGNSKPLTLYVNIYERGEVFIPQGLTAKK